MGTDPSLDISDELIEAHELAAVYGSLTALRGINLSVRPGEVVAPGAKGAGKTKRLLTLDGVLPTSRTRNSRRERYHCTTAPSLPAAGHGPLQTAIDARRRLTPRDRRYDTLMVSRTVGQSTGSEPQVPPTMWRCWCRSRPGRCGRVSGRGLAERASHPAA